MTIDKPRNGHSKSALIANQSDTVVAEPVMDIALQAVEVFRFNIKQLQLNAHQIERTSRLVLWDLKCTPYDFESI